jgi:tRNA-dihydrouridine synthase B
MRKNNLLELLKNKNLTALAPMAGITDLPFRIICKRCGADAVYTEMISAKALCYKNEKSVEMLITSAEESPCVAQLFSSEPDVISSAVSVYINNSDFAGIDINMGCPVAKVVKSGEGSALMRQPEKAYNIVRAVKDISMLPVSVKIRSGWNENEKNAVEFSALMQKAGADIIIIHPRTREQFFSGHSDWNLIKEIKNTLEIPVIASGDVTSPEKAAEILNTTDADGIMIGRAAMGNPWIFAQIKQYQKDGYYTKPSVEEILRQIEKHLNMAICGYNEHNAAAAMRKHIFWYTKGLPDSARIRNMISTAKSRKEMLDILYDNLK